MEGTETDGESSTRASVEAGPSPPPTKRTKTTYSVSDTMAPLTAHTSAARILAARISATGAMVPLLLVLQLLAPFFMLRKIANSRLLSPNQYRQVALLLRLTINQINS